MNVGSVAKIAGQAVTARSSVKAFRRARTDHDRLQMVDAILTGLSVAVTIAILVREIRRNQAQTSRLVDLEEMEK